VLTKVGKELGIVGVNLSTGETDRELVLGTKEPEYLVDEQLGRVYFFKGGKNLVAYKF